MTIELPIVPSFNAAGLMIVQVFLPGTGCDGVKYTHSLILSFDGRDGLSIECCCVVPPEPGTISC